MQRNIHSEGMFYSPEKNKALFRVLFDEQGHRFIEFYWKSNKGKKHNECIEQENFIRMLRNADAIHIANDKKSENSNDI